MLIIILLKDMVGFKYGFDLVYQVLQIETQTNIELSQYIFHNPP